MYTLTDQTSGQSWNYDSEAQLKTATRLYAIQHPKSAIAVTINGVTSKVR